MTSSIGSQLGLAFGDAFAAETPAALPKRKAVKRPLSVAPAPSAARLNDGLSDLLAVPAPAPALPLAPAPQPATLGSPDVAALAALLEAHPDYRVLRRLVPVYDFGGEPSGAVARVILLDTETTGLNPAQDKVVELALLRVTIDLRTGLPVGRVEVYGGLEDPGMPMPEEARAVTGITDEMLQGQRLDDARIAAMLDGVDLVLAHNAGFDRPFIEARVPQFASLNWACSFADIDWKHEGRESAKLSALAMALGLFYDAHRAEMDCHALLAVLTPALPVSGRTEGLNAQGKAELNGVNGLTKLILAAKSPLYRLQATAAPFDAKDALKARGYRWDGTSRVWHTRLTDDALLEAECQWLKSAVYRGGFAKVQVEALDALVKYSARPGKLGWREL